MDVFAALFLSIVVVLAGYAGFVLLGALVLLPTVILELVQNKTRRRS